MRNDRNDAAAARQGIAIALMGMSTALAVVAVVMFGGRVSPAQAQATGSTSRAASAATGGARMRPASLEVGSKAAGPGPTDSEVYDAEAYWHFARLEGFYRIEGHVVACIQKADGHWDFWDPRRDVLLGTKNLDCVPPTGSRSVEPTIVSHQIEGSPASVESDASFYGATGIWWQVPDFQHCDEAFDRLYTAEAPGSAGYSFYVLTRRRHAHTVDLRGEACGLVPGVVTLQYTPRYDDILRVQSLDLGDHRTLIATRDDDDRPVVVVIHDRPSRAWTGAQGVSIVPATLLRPALEKAGPDFAARERVVAQLLDGAH
jgi:hypothetical protein